MRAPWGWVKAAAAVGLHVGSGIAGMASGCAGPSAANPEPAGPAMRGEDATTAVRLDRGVAELDLYWRGQAAGRAREQLLVRPGGGGFRFARAEHWRVARGGSLVEWEIEIVIDADCELRGEKVTFFRDRELRGSAHRSRSGWVIEDAVAGGRTRRAPARAEPAELALVRLARSGASRWAGPVLLAGFDFAVAELAIEPDRGGLRMVLSAPSGRQETRVWLRDDGTVERAAGPDLSATRRQAGRDDLRRDAAHAHPPPDLVEQGVIRVSGQAPYRSSDSRADVGIELELAAAGERRGGQPAPRVELPGQRIRSGASGWRVELGRPSGRADIAAWPRLMIPDPPPGPALAALADRIAGGSARNALAELRALAAATAAAVEDDLSRGAVSSAAEAATTGRGDCIAHAALFSALARARGFDLRLVTGYRLEGRVLTRHVWAAVRLGRTVVAVDPTFGEAPAAPGHLLGLAIHGSAPGEIALAAELAFAGLSGARARFVAR